MNIINNILIVDDEPLNLEILELSLEELDNISIISALNGFKALEQVKKNTVDLIILDLSMPEMDGLEVLSILKEDEVLRYIPVIVVTAKTEDRYKALEMGAEDFLSKPIDVVELRFKVNNLLKLKKFNDLQQHFNQRLEEEVTKKEQQLKQFAQVEQELQLAREIQQHLIPKSYPSTEVLDVYGSCVSASEVGGDYLDVFRTEDDKHTVFIMADVSGHGFASALVSMQFRSLARMELMKGSEAFGKEIERINTVFSNDNQEGSMFITALFLRLNHETNIMESVNAGHFDPLGQPQLIHTASTKGIPLGIQGDLPYGVVSAPFKAGDSLLLYTDGIIECENDNNEMYGNRFNAQYTMLQSFDPKTQIEILLEAFHEFIAMQTDDVTILSIQAK
ncbi:MAG: Serine phosphatase RsbU, regulator of sigma subunit [uncultured Sulfurovum sp.]|uniref:Serine phosphatase RsbU, regulator of sigma subunit n=1 Tax=uncultured Sulfurovum sp. TaxID=269237 RepID=A0A6S6TNH8_9BACT|nr:MAG: Serine phosphatase RsbU, regulator of sigma subunit [uncultured Sulfurovum sp.]